jgi:hypothetical protein
MGLEGLLNAKARDLPGYVFNISNIFRNKLMPGANRSIDPELPPTYPATVPTPSAFHRRFDLVYRGYAMRTLLAMLITLLGLGGSTLSARRSPDAIPAIFHAKNAAWASRNLQLEVPATFERERGVAWDGRIGWKTEERVWVFAAALEASLKGIIRAESPYRLSVAVIRVERQTGIFVVEFSIQDPSGASVEQVQVEGIGPRNRVLDEVYPALAGEIVAAFEKSILQ